MTKGIVVIGASTGGPAALEYLLPNFPSSFAYPVIVVQHLPKHFVDTFTQRVSKKCQMDFIQAYDGLIIVPNTIYIVSGDINTEIITDVLGQTRIKTSSDTVEIETPSINKLMISAAKIYQENTLGIILTGMGKDGTLGMGAVKERGGATLVQDEETSVVFGMGKEVINKGWADEVVPLNEIIRRTIEITNSFK